MSADPFTGAIEKFGFRCFEDPLEPCRIVFPDTALVNLHTGGLRLQRQHVSCWNFQTVGNHGSRFGGEGSRLGEEVAAGRARDRNARERGKVPATPVALGDRDVRRRQPCRENCDN